MASQASATESAKGLHHCKELFDTVLRRPENSVDAAVLADETGRNWEFILREGEVTLKFLIDFCPFCGRRLL